MNLKSIIRPLLLLCMLVVATACGIVEEPEANSSGAHNSNDGQFYEGHQLIVQGNNALGFKLLEAAKADEQGNIFISPTSLMMAMSMVYNGADGVTKEEIAKVLQIEGIELEQLNEANASLLSKLHESDEVELEITNSIWLNEMFQFQNDFAQNNKDYYNAKIEEIDVADSKSADMINDWVKEATNEKIESIVEAPLDPDLVSILVNAIYFKGVWAYPFDPEWTVEEPFHLMDGVSADVSLMTLAEELAYMENDQFQAVRLPYRESDMDMTIYLPQEGQSLEAFKKHLTLDNWLDWQTEFRSREGTIMLPKFQLSYEVELKEALQHLGLQTAFDREDANFSKMIEEEGPIWISEMKHKTFIDVNEEGTEAAGVTSVEMKTTSAPVEEPFQMKVNRPFFITISDNETGTILFLGEIANPLMIE